MPKHVHTYIRVGGTRIKKKKRSPRSLESGSRRNDRPPRCAPALRLALLAVVISVYSAIPQDATRDLSGCVHRKLISKHVYLLR